MFKKYVWLPDNNRSDQAFAPEDFFDYLHLFGPVALIPDLSSLLEWFPVDKSANLWLMTPYQLNVRYNS